MTQASMLGVDVSPGGFPEPACRFHRHFGSTLACRISTARATVSPIAQKLQGGKAKNACISRQSAVASRQQVQKQRRSEVSFLTADRRLQTAD
jgi:hypothetical protein